MTASAALELLTDEYEPTTASSLGVSQMFNELPITKFRRARFGKLGQFLEQLLIHFFEVKARLALHALLQFRRHALQQIGAGVNRHQIEADICFAQAYTPPKQSGCLFFMM